jgi:hypothetical protein
MCEVCISASEEMRNAQLDTGTWNFDWRYKSIKFVLNTFNLRINNHGYVLYNVWQA